MPDIIKPSALTTVPGHEEVTVLYEPGYHDYDGKAVLKFVYLGTSDALIAAGIATAEMLAVGSNTGKRPRRVDDKGHSYSRSFWWVGVNEGNPRRMFKLLRFRSQADYRELPGAEKAKAVAETHWDRLKEAGEAIALGRTRDDEGMIIPETVQRQVDDLLAKFRAQP